jgi:hypothetical protein
MVLSILTLAPAIGLPWVSVTTPVAYPSSSIPIGPVFGSASFSVSWQEKNKVKRRARQGVTCILNIIFNSIGFVLVTKLETSRWSILEVDQ